MVVDATLSSPDMRALLRAARGRPAPSALLTLVLEAPADAGCRRFMYLLDHQGTLLDVCRLQGIRVAPGVRAGEKVCCSQNCCSSIMRKHCSLQQQAATAMH